VNLADFLDCSEFQRCKREALLNGEPVQDLGDGGGKFVLYECIRATKSPIALLAQELGDVPTKRQVADFLVKDQQAISHYCRKLGFWWLPSAKPGIPAPRMARVITVNPSSGRVRWTSFIDPKDFSLPAKNSHLRAATDVLTFFRDSVHPFRGCCAKEDEGGDYACKV
jgi:hypothetical protein